MLTGGVKHQGPRELTHKFYTARAEQSRIVFLDVSDGFVHQLSNVFYTHSFPCWAHLQRKKQTNIYLPPACTEMQKDSVHPVGTEVHFIEQGSVGAGEFLGRNLRAKCLDKEVQILCHFAFKAEQFQLG